MKITSKEEMKFKFIIGATCIAIFVIGVIWITIDNNETSRVYPGIRIGENIDDTVSSVKNERSFSRITFISGMRRTIYFSRNKSYSPSDLALFLRKGDRFLKKKDSDTVTIFSANTPFVFVLNNDIRCCKIN